jgi:hypothetical protein
MLPDGRRDRTAYNAEKMSNPDYQTKTYVLDHVEQTFTLRVRSLTGVSESQIKNLLEKQYEVTSIIQIVCQTIGLQCHD